MMLKPQCPHISGYVPIVDSSALNASRLFGEPLKPLTSIWNNRREGQHLKAISTISSGKRTEGSTRNSVPRIAHKEVRKGRHASVHSLKCWWHRDLCVLRSKKPAGWRTAAMRTRQHHDFFLKDTTWPGEGIMAIR